jgi:hypothetical protein
MAAALTVPNPLLRVPESHHDVLGNRRNILSEHGDPFTLMNLFTAWLKVKAEGRVS